MTNEIKPDATQATTQDAQLAAESMTEGKEKMPKVDVDADYAAAQQFSVSDIDRTNEGAEAADKATANQFATTTPSDTTTESLSTGDPSDYMAMAKDVGTSTGAAGNVDDDLIQKALEKGQPGK
ncbi:hypothetical protein [Synechocystis sp. PCC 7509]|uniref:hypothetical protein n=1 Tax=Synechocystis sp. PCC 7509 TaxID=927677 RepID=UPI0002AD196C|nr:hypothetical protein [Synechocystis sp. PCC 7509]